MAPSTKLLCQETPVYRLIRSRRRTVSLILRQDGVLEVRCPLSFPRGQADAFVRDKADWVARKRKEDQDALAIYPLPSDQVRSAEERIRQRFDRILTHYPVGKPHKVLIRDLVSRWGSCSSLGTVSINRRCAVLPDELIDYVILHELCHLTVLDHSPQFWRLLAGYLPDCLKRRRAMNRYRLQRTAAGGINC